MLKTFICIHLYIKKITYNFFARQTKTAKAKDTFIGDLSLKSELLTFIVTDKRLSLSKRLKALSLSLACSSAFTLLFLTTQHPLGAPFLTVFALLGLVGAALSAPWSMRFEKRMQRCRNDLARNFYRKNLRIDDRYRILSNTPDATLVLMLSSFHHDETLS